MLSNMCEELLKAADSKKVEEPIPFALPDITQREIEAVVDSMKANWITTGPVAAQFEGELEDFVGRPTLALNSATAGLHLALASLRLQPGDEVIVPAMTFVASVETIIAAGGKPVLCDVERNTQNTTLELIHEKVTSKTRAVVLVHFAGSPVRELAAIVNWCNRYGIKVIEDAAHAFGAQLDGVRIGAYPTYATVWSFYATKCITTAEGGAISTASRELLEFVRCNRLHGIDRNVFGRYTSNVPSWEYDVVDVGWKYNMTDMAAAMGRVQLQREREMREKRASIAWGYNEWVNATRANVWPITQTDGSSYHLFPVRVPDRERFVRRMFDQGIGVSVHFKPIYRLTAYRSLGTPDQFPGVESYWPFAVSLPVYSKMTHQQIRRVMHAMEKY